MIRNLDEILSQLEIIKVNKAGKEISPHKYVFLLAILNKIESYDTFENKFYLDEDLENTFKQLYVKLWGRTANANAIECPFAHLRNDGFWFLKIKPGFLEKFKEYDELENCRITKKRLLETVEFGYFSEDFFAVILNKESRLQIRKRLIDIIRRYKVGFDREDQKEGEVSMHKKNEYVLYLNSLHSVDGSSDNSLAEFQALNKHFLSIRVHNPLVNKITQILSEQKKRHVVLTGHAGDGKSTIAMEVFRRLCPEMQKDESLLSRYMKKREDITVENGNSVSIIKDLSEWDENSKIELMREMIDSDTHFFIVSNTGTLLNLFCNYGEQELGLSVTEIETRILSFVSSNTDEEAEIFKTIFTFTNLALMDNLHIAEQIFNRMLDVKNWEICKHLNCRKNCPIFMNVQLIHSRKDIVIKRIFLAYRRMYEYGTRLTLRQITAHLAYILTSGFEYKEIQEKFSHPDPPPLLGYLFFNRFFGDDGEKADSEAQQLMAIRAIRNQSFGRRPCPSWERMLWLQNRADSSLIINNVEIDKILSSLREVGSSKDSKSSVVESPSGARNQTRRILYFFVNEKDIATKLWHGNMIDLYIGHFLRSSSIVQWDKWQNSEIVNPEFEDKNKLMSSVFHVLQEQYAGVRLPEFNDPPANLYLTLSRQDPGMRQSVQLELACISTSVFLLSLSPRHVSNGSFRNELVLEDKSNQDLQLKLDLPFLDYMNMRNLGETGEVLQSSYLDRLESFKSRLLNCYGPSITESNELIVIQLSSTNKFLRQKLTVGDHTVEVRNAH